MGSTTQTQSDPVVLLLQACDGALVDVQATETIHLQLIQKQSDQIQIQAKEMLELNKEKDSILRSPVLWFALGVIATGAAVHLAR